jgi:polyhydroxyalkanoate synthesis repressor PhaR
MPVIKRYPNRKLYDTEAKKYINLEDIAGMIRAGHEIRVIDNASGEDLTAVTLTQIVFELEKKQNGILPGPVLASLIQAGGSRLSALQRSLLSQLGFIGQVDDEIRQRIHALVAQGDLLESEGAQLIEKLMAAGRKALSPSHPPDEAAIERVLNQRNIPSRQDMERILGELDGLMSKLHELEAAQSAAENAEPNAPDDQN